MAANNPIVVELTEAERTELLQDLPAVAGFKVLESARDQLDNHGPKQGKSETN
jgi:hypothetical protein